MSASAGADTTMTGLPVVAVTRYVTPLREGGSLPGIVEAADLGTYVCKFWGAGQGTRVLVAEVIVAALARRIGLRTPRLIALDLDPAIARYEADEEVQDLLNASPGINLGVDFLPGSFGYDGALPDVDEGVTLLWLDALCANVDRSWRNPNLLLWHGRMWAIDHGASLYFHHGWGSGIGDPERFAAQPYDASDHVCAALADRVPARHAALAAQLTEDVVRAAVADVPDPWLGGVHGATPEDVRAGYVAFLTARLRSTTWLPGANLPGAGS